ncbi:MAG: calcium/sodium antiporter [Saprospiraceae bacterium]|nr:calcium/sodium antiporter [Saprospiraceae bacterium]
MTILLLIGGLVLLIAGAEALVRGASKLAAAVGISPLVIGLTVVAYGTSTPELVVSTISSLEGNPDIAVGNVVGSNIFNVLFILGISALIAPLVVSQQLVRLDVPIMIAVSLLVVMMGWDGKISFFEGIFLVAGIITYTIFLIRQSRKEKSKEVKKEYEQEYGDGKAKKPYQWLINTVLVLVGLAMLVVGSNWLIDSSITIAKQLGVSELVIGLTIVAAGTSLPEVATSILATIKGERDIAVGNVVGSNIYNILAVLGVSSIVSPDGLPVSQAMMQFDIPVMIATAVACLPIFMSSHTIKRWEGAVFLGYYIAYTVYLVLNSTKHSALQAFETGMMWFVIPITLLTLIVITVQSINNRRKSKV